MWRRTLFSSIFAFLEMASGASAEGKHVSCSVYILGVEQKPETRTLAFYLDDSGAQLVAEDTTITVVRTTLYSGTRIDAKIADISSGAGTGTIFGLAVSEPLTLQIDRSSGRIGLLGNSLPRGVILGTGKCSPTAAPTP